MLHLDGVESRTFEGQGQPGKGGCCDQAIADAAIGPRRRFHPRENSLSLSHGVGRRVTIGGNAVRDVRKRESRAQRPMHHLCNRSLKRKEILWGVVLRTLHCLGHLALPEEFGFRVLEEMECCTHEVAELHGGLELFCHREDQPLEPHLF
jgi:hypothetical protein